MPSFPVERIRNVALLSHSGAGKTTLCEAMLYATGAISRMGRVEDGNTTSDFEPEEVRRRSSIQTSVIPCVAQDTRLTFLDTPGYDDFLGEVLAALQVADAAVIVVAAPAGVEVGSERAWALCEERRLPRMVVVNKMDRENADFFRCLESVQAAFGRRCVPIQVPVGAAQGFKGVVDLVRPPASVPAEAQERLQGARERLVEAVAEVDDELATKFLEGEELSQEEIVRGLRQGVLAGTLVPVLATAAPAQLGVPELLRACADLFPSPAERPAVAVAGGNGAQVELKPDPGAPLVAYVFKTSADPFVGKLSYFRVYRGTLRANSEVLNASKGQTERIGSVYLMRGKNQESVPDLGPGEIGAVSKLQVTGTGDALCAREQPVTFPPLQLPTPNYVAAVFARTKADVDKMSTSLARLAEEDPSLRVYREPDTGETLIAGLGDTHVETAIEKVKRKFGTDLYLQVPKVPYKETIASVAKAEYKHKKQTGGRGQYGHVFLRVEPLERGAGFQFASEVVGGAVPKEYIPAVEKGVQKALQEGVVAGYPVVDIKAVIYDGSFHPVDSSGISFEIAGYYALKKGVQQGTPVLLEPIVHLQVRVPDQFTGDIIGDLNAKRARILGMTPQNGVTVIDDEVPLAEVQRYATDLRSLTQGRGTYSLEFVRYEEVPAHLVPKMAEQAKQQEARV